jgi:DNA-binding NarL/FixJ family response regulator
MALSQELQLLGYTVCGMAVSGEQAIEKAERETPDVVIMDIHIQGAMGGIEAAKSIRSRVGSRIAFISGYPDEEIRQSVMELDPIGYFVKPFNIKQLESAIDEAFPPGGHNLRN